MRLCLSAGLLAALGCSSQTPPPAAEGSAAEASASEDAAGEGMAGVETAAQIDVVVASAEQIDAAIAAARPSIVVLDCWSTSCTPCLKEFHHLVELHGEYADRGVRCMSLSFDFDGGPGGPEQAAEQPLAFLRSQGAAFANFVSSTPADELYAHFGFGAVPAVFVYDAAGDRRKFAPSFGNDTVYDEVGQYVEELLAASK